MIVTIQALVILFTGAMSDMLRRPVELSFLTARLRGKEPVTERSSMESSIISILDHHDPPRRRR